MNLRQKQLFVIQAKIQAGINPLQGFNLFYFCNKINQNLMLY